MECGFVLRGNGGDIVMGLRILTGSGVVIGGGVFVEDLVEHLLKRGVIALGT